MENVGPDAVAQTLMKYAAIVQGERVEIDLNRMGNAVEARIGGRIYTLEVREVEPGIYSFIWENNSLEATVAEYREGYVVSIGNRRIPVEMVDARAVLRRPAYYGHDGAVEIRAPMPGKVVKVLVPEGAAIQANQGIVVMEAMKMQNEIRSPRQGIVRKLAVVEGAAVNAGDLIAVVEGSI